MEVDGTVRLVVDDTNAAYPLTVAPLLWIQQADVKPADSTASFGNSVSLSGDSLLIGDPYKGTAGAAHMFMRSSSSWSYQATLAPSDPGGNDYFLGAVAISEDTAAVGAWGKGYGTGAAYVFQRSGTTWSQEAKVTEPGGRQFRPGCRHLGRQPRLRRVGERQ